MNLIKLSIPFSFINGRSRLTWREIVRGIENELLASGAAVDFARDELACQDDPSTVLVQSRAQR